MARRLAIHSHVIVVCSRKLAARPAFLQVSSKGPHKQFPIPVIQNNRFAPITPVHDVINRPFVFHSQFARHDTTVLHRRFTSIVTHYNIDPTPIARICVGFDGKIDFLSLPELTALLERMDVAILKMSIMDCVDTHSNIFHLPNRALIRPYGVGEFYNIAMVSGVPKENYGILGCIHRALLEQGKSPQWHIEKRVAQLPVFGMLDAIVVSIKTA
jgi:hypothetical protein